MIQLLLLQILNMVHLFFHSNNVDYHNEIKYMYHRLINHLPINREYHNLFDF